jgi:hypothetical protein
MIFDQHFAIHLFNYSPIACVFIGFLAMNNVANESADLISPSAFELNAACDFGAEIFKERSCHVTAHEAFQLLQGQRRA